MSSVTLPEPVELEFNLFKFSDGETKKNPVLIHHGLFSSKETYSTLAPLISQSLQRDVYVFDARNHGKSPRTETMSPLDNLSDQVNFIKKNNLTKVVLIGHSIGGKAYALLSQMFPEYVEKLVMVDINPVKNYNEEKSESFAQLTTFLKMILDQVNSSETKLTLDEAIKKCESIFFGKTEVKLMEDIFKTSLVEKDDKFDYLFNINAIDSFAKSTLVDYHVDDKFSGESLLVYGGKSEFFSKEECNAVSEKFVNCKFECIEEADHNLNYLFPNEFVAILKKFDEEN